MKFTVVYSREFNHEIECDSMETAHIRSKNFAIGMSNNLTAPCKIISIHAENYVAGTAVGSLTFYETMVNGMRKNLDKLSKKEP